MSMRPFITAFASATLPLLAVGSVSGFQGSTLSPVALQSFDFQPRAGLILLPVTIEGKRYDFAVDTGSNRSIFDLSLSPKLGEPLRALNFKGSDNAEEFKWPVARLGKVNLVSEQHVVCLDLSEFQRQTGQEFYGILGMDWLQHRAFEIDFDKGRVTFLSSNSLPPRFISNGTPIEIEACQARVEVDVTGLGRVPFLIDTGHLGQLHLLQTDCSRLKAARKMKGLEEGETWEFDRGSTTTKIGAVETLRLGDFSYEWPIFYTNPDDQDRTLGLEIWSKHVAIFDFPNRVLNLRRGKRFGEPWVHNMSGFSINKPDGDMTIESIAADSPSSTLGINPGNILVSVEDKPAAEYGIWEIYRLFSVIGKTYKLKLRRFQNEFEVDLPIAKW